MGKKKQVGIMASAGAKSLISKLAKVAYGYVREDLSNRLSNTEIVQRLPATEFTDEAVMLAANFGAKKLGGSKIPILRSILNAQQTVELARIGQTVKDIHSNRATAASGGSSSGLLF